MIGGSRAGESAEHGAPAALAAGVEDALRALAEGAQVDAAGELECRGAVRQGHASWVLPVLHRPSGALQALKLLRPGLLDEPALVQAFDEWTERATALPGKFAARVAGAGRLTALGGTAVPPLRTVSLEWLEGRSARELVAAGQGLPPERAFNLAQNAARCVAELHRAGMLHADVRPEHLVLTRQTARLIDVGMPPAVRARAEALFGGTWTSSAYAPPELLEGGWERLDRASDVYQLAVLTYELFTGKPCSPWVPYEELSEIVDFAPLELDVLVQDCLCRPELRPPDGDAFFARLREAALTFEDNQRSNRARRERKPKQLWAEATAVAERGSPPWGVIASLCERMLDEKPKRLPIGKVPSRQVERLLQQARRELQGERRRHFDTLLERRAWPAAAAFLDRMSDEVAAGEVSDLRLLLEMAQIAGTQADAQSREAASKRLVELVRRPELSVSQRASATQLLEKLMLAPPPPSPARKPIPVLTDLGCLPPSERWQVQVGEKTAKVWVVVGPAMRLGRGSLEEFGNHVDLRPSRREAAENSTLLLLAQTLSRAGHLELRVGPDGLEAFCLGSHGATVDGAALRRGEGQPLRREGDCSLANGASAFIYRVWGGRDELPAAVEIRFVGGIGTGKRAIWALGPLPSEVLAAEAAGSAWLLPGPEGWRVEPSREGISQAECALEPGLAAPWPDEAVLRLGPACWVQRT